jgi:Ribosomal protein S5, C-terminal domain
MNVVKATFAALEAQQRPIDIAKLRGKTVSDVRSVYYGLPYHEKQNLWDE